jgi:hypothetical protein
VKMYVKIVLGYLCLRLTIDLKYLSAGLLVRVV